MIVATAPVLSVVALRLSPLTSARAITLIAWMVAWPALNNALAVIARPPLPVAIAVTFRYVLVFVAPETVVWIAVPSAADATTVLLRMVLFWICAVLAEPRAISWSTVE